MKSERIFSKSSNKKGLWCPFKPVLCQEDYCHECQIYLDWQREDSTTNTRSNVVKEKVVKMTNNNNDKASRQDTKAMKMRIALVIVSTFLVQCGGTWAYAFFIILQQGEVTFYEPNGPLLMVEFGLAAALTLMGLFFLGVAIRK